MELCLCTTAATSNIQSSSITNLPKYLSPFRTSTTSLTIKQTHLSPFNSRRLLLHSRGPRATFSEEQPSNQYGSVAVKEATQVPEPGKPPEPEPEEAKVSVQEESLLNDFLDTFNIKFDSEDTYSLILYGSGALVALWLTSAVVGAIDSIPLFPKLMEVVGLGYTAWFIARYLLFKESRDELAAKLEELKQEVIGSDDD